MRLTVYPKYDNSRKNGIMIDPNSYFDELKVPYDLKIAETKSKIKGHLEQYTYYEDGIRKNRCFVSSSHGKDSVVMVVLVKQVCDELQIPMIPIFLNNTLNIYPEELKYWKSFNKRYNLTDAFKVFIPPKDADGKQITVKSIREKNGNMENFRNKKNYIFNPKTGNTVLKYSPDCCEQLKRLSVNDHLMNDGLHLQCSFDGRRAVENRNRSRNILQRGCTYETDFERPRKIRAFLPIAYFTDEDRNRFLIENFIPVCPAYENHNIERMGCRDCVAYKSWIINLATDPTDLGVNDLKRNLTFMKEHQPDRMIDEIKYSIHQIHLNKIKVNHKAMQVLSEFTGQQLL